MKRLVVWSVLIGLACAGAVSASTYVGYSDAFGINNTKGDTRPKPPSYTLESPYFNAAPWGLLRGQLHCHRAPDTLNELVWILPEAYLGMVGWEYATTLSPQQLANRYIGAGFQFMAQTEHDELSPITASGIAYAKGSDEITRGSYVPPFNRDDHVLAVNTLATSKSQIEYDGPGDKVAKSVQRIQRIQALGGLAFIAHPDSCPFAVTVDEMSRICGARRPDGIAIYNSSWPGKSAEAYWNSLLDRGVRVYGYAEEDYHPGMGSIHKIGSAWVAVPSDTALTWDTIGPHLAAGNYYSYWVTGGSWDVSRDGLPPEIRITKKTGVVGEVPEVQLRKDGNPYSAQIYFITKGWKMDAGYDSEAALSFGDDPHYIRVKVEKNLGWGRKLHIASQPLFVNASNASSGWSPPASMRSLLGGSAELHLRYLEAGEVPEPPTSGYVGRSFGVTTDTGTVPPAATLQLSFDGEDTSAIGGTQYLAIYRYDDTAGAWVKVGGTADPATATIESPITALGKYCISADLPADTTAPEVWIDNPPYAASVPADTTVKATVNDDLGAWRVRFYMNGHLLAEDADSSDGWGADLKVSDYCTGDWTLKAEAEDLAGNVGTAQIPIHIVSSTPPPTVTISSPGAGYVLNGTVTATGTCGDDVAVASVTLKIGDTVLGFADVSGSTWTCSIDTTYLADGNRTLTATTEDYPGNSASATVPVVINNAAATSPLGNVKNASEGAPIRFASAVVVADSSMVGDGFYAEAINRTSGVKVLSGAGIHVGDAVSVVGAKTTIGHEAVVQAQDVAVISTGNTLPKPIANYATKLLLAPDSIGKIVKLWGTIGVKDTATPPTWFMLNDQSGVAIKCKLASDVTFDPAWTLIAVTGVVCTEDISGATQIDLLVTDSTSIQPLVGS